MQLTSKQRRALVALIVGKLNPSDALVDLENLISLSEIPQKAHIRRHRDAFSFAVAIVQHCEAYGADDRVDAMEALLSGIVDTLGGWTALELESLSRFVAPDVPASPAGRPSHDIDPNVFLCHNSKDKPPVLQIAVALRARGIKPWLDQDLSAGDTFVREIDRVITNARCAVIFVGSHGFGRWQELEIAALIRHSVERGMRLVPVVLPGLSDQPSWPSFLNDLQRVDFRLAPPAPLEQLVSAIATNV